MIIDAEGLILGRLSSVVAKRLLEGEEITIINAEKAVVSGSKVAVFKEYKQMRDKGSTEKGPYYPRMPDQILKRTVRGMLPFKRLRGREAYARLRVYIGVPDEFKDQPSEKIENADMNRLGTVKYIRLDELSTRLGAKWLRS
ncbi:MAG: 50S ribosomal protein L13 [Halobacteriota archaeon]|nr:50S ribosomal protein L13 [Halobacteriota archaeon]